jgi:hypothetical protein
VRRDGEAADRSAEVRAAARAWHRASAIDEKTLEAISREYPDDRSRVRPAFRVILFLFTFVAGVSAVGLLSLLGMPEGALFFSGALGSMAATELQMGKLRRSGGGAEEATAVLSFGLSVAALAWSLERSGGDFPLRVLSVAAAALAALAAWRWGIWLFGAVAAACLFLALSFWTGARISWVLAALALVFPLLSASVSSRLAPSHRRASDAALVVALCALYLAVHLGSYDLQILERAAFFGLLDRPAGLPGRWAFVAATAIVPSILLVAGVSMRRPLLLRTGAVLGVVSLVTLRFYINLAPLYLVLGIAGGVAVALGLVLERWLASGPGRARGGFTADPLFGEGGPYAKAIDAGLGMALAPGAAAGGKPGFEGAGGDFGGGGATGKY